MNIKLTLAAALLLSATPAFAQTRTESGSKAKAGAASGGKLSVVSTESIDQDGDEGKVNRIELQVDNGKITVKRNGKEIPADRIRTEDDGSVIILDENGDPVDNVRLFTGGGQGEMRFFNGENAFPGFRMLEGGEGNSFWLGGDEDGEQPKVMIGVHMSEPGEALQKHLHLKPGKCAIITGVFEGLPAEVAGIGEHDIIVAIDGSDEADAGTIRKILTSKEPGDTCTVRVIQAGEAKEFRIKLQGFDAKKLGSAKLIGKEPTDQMWTSAFGPANGLGGELNRIAEIPNIEERIFVSPKDVTEWRGMTNLQDLNMAELEPKIQDAIKNAMKSYEGAIRLRENPVDDAGESEVESQLDRLDKRMAQLEAMIEKLVNQKAKP